MIWAVIAITFISGVFGTGLGGAVGALFKQNSDKIVSYLLSFAAGVMLSVVSFELILDAIDFKNPQENINIFVVASCILVGYMAVAYINYLINKNYSPKKNKNAIIFGSLSLDINNSNKSITSNNFNNSNSNNPNNRNFLNSNKLNNINKQKSPKNNNLYISGLILSIIIAVHNLPEGMVIGSSYAGVDISNFMKQGGFLLAIVIGLHNIPEGMAVSVPLISGGMKKNKAIFITSLSGFPTVIGAIIGYYLGSINSLMQAIMLSLSSGAMLYVVFAELLPESILICKSKLPPLYTMIGMLVGMIIIFI